MDILSLLSKLLADVNRGNVEMPPSASMDRVLTQLEKQVKQGDANDEPRDRQEEAVKRFWNSGEFESLRDARLVCFGLTVRPWGDSRCVIEDADRFDWVLKGLREWEDSPRQYRKCYQGLVRSYFEYDGMGRNVPAAGGKNWRTLQHYLNVKAPLIRDATINPDWVDCVFGNRGLFTSEPCAAYGAKLMSGRSDEVTKVRELLGITDASWFTRELVLSQISHACEQGHHEFTALLPQLLKLLQGNEVLRDRGLRKLLERYIEVPGTPQHPELKDFCVTAWGNPWLPSNEHRWGGVSEDIRQMVGDWLKLEYIELFFTKLDEDNVGDSRRIKFWSQFVRQIDHIHFALGHYAFHSTSRDFVELRSKLEGLITPLQDANQYNNAFIMTIGDLVAVEFSGRSNAFYGYSSTKKLPFDYSKPLRTAVNYPNSLKNTSCVLKLSHTDTSYKTWEEKFSEELLVHFDIRLQSNKNKRAIRSQVSASPIATEETRIQQLSGTQQPPSDLIPRHLIAVLAGRKFNESDFQMLAQKMGVETEDRRKLGGGLWFVYHGSEAAVLDLLCSWEFQYITGKGWVRFS